MHEQAVRCHHGTVNPERRDSTVPRRPTLLGPVAVDGFVGGADPAQRIEAAHTTAQALLRHARSGNDEVTARLVALTDVHGLDAVATLWADRPAHSLPGVLWRLYALRAGIHRDPCGLARVFDVGRRRAPVAEAIAGVADPPGQDEVRALADAVLTGAFAGDLAVALERAGAFCRVLATGWAVLADDEADDGQAGALTRRAAGLLRTAGQLEEAATRWRTGTLQ
ncbi:MAG: hypothetical protein QG608_69 [Actinomycetota bacterium]|nr:hypothetical protein [Actinomycetota bacterium]